MADASIMSRQQSSFPALPAMANLAAPPIGTVKQWQTLLGLMKTMAVVVASNNRMPEIRVVDLAGASGAVEKATHCIRSVIDSAVKWLKRMK